MKPEDKKLMEQLGFKCQKCDYYDPLGKKLSINKEHKTVLCNVCNVFAPIDVENFELYLTEKINPHILETFRKHAKGDLNHALKKGMMEVAKKGKIVVRPAYGYRMDNGNLVPSENSDQVREIFRGFEKGQSLNALSRLHGISVNGIKKILKNFTYIGKVKFDNQILQGKHKPILETDLFNSVQKRFEKLKNAQN